ncbi:solute carrier family 31 (copper transporter), member 1 [Coccidioides immitis RS]|uniref:Copper transport protein n=3 Tax=Coccidioides immitis TaxID=5501 RepID=J3K3Q8_COCIM|nr:solute carrier family 31 (copper transporter), member 1 [Coccidioides immitis RS]EAS28849.3 solute carrier family 31 (copper transporter), member 1 [Coccidioides immitis RS]KMP05967.1 hypothetical protein CIRG_05648 [Coccidioides immitis RMSCC 2394]KMU76598.1 hypothetical protein CISG_05741 [Coccidioides immitis RMSCC 3703]
MDHSGHGDMDMGHDQCSMNMLFTWSTKNLCLVFRQWRVTGPVSLLFSLVGVILLTAGYEAVRELTRRYEGVCGRGVKGAIPAPGSEEAYGPTENHHRDDESSSLLFPARNVNTSEPVGRRRKIVIASLYGVQVFYSFFIMLLFMTYNGWVMISVGIGAFLGYLTFGSSSAAKSASCH